MKKQKLKSFRSQSHIYLKKLVLLCVFMSIFFQVMICDAAPTVTNVDGRVEGGYTITIEGIEFGSNGPTVLYFNDFEGGVSGTNIRQGDKANIGEVSEVSGTAGSPYYTNAASLSGNLSHQSNMSGIPNGGYAWSQITFTTKHKRRFWKLVDLSATI